ncbi:ribonuclease H-like domain-containing protein [Tanacetum coccineum]
MESQLETTQIVFTLKLLVLKTGEYDLWSMRMEQYLTFTDHTLWEVIVNGDSVSPVASASTSAEECKSLWEAIKNRFEGNKESKKMQKTILKQNYENFTASSQEGLDKTYDMFLKLISQLEIHGRKMDLNDKDTVGFDMTKVECYNCHRRGHFSIECMALRNQGNRNRDAPRRNAPVDTSTTNALVVQDGIGGYD